MVYLFENADEICEKFQQANHDYPPRLAAPQASSKAVGQGKLARGYCERAGEAVPARCLALGANLTLLQRFPRVARQPAAPEN
jgi:hypothetical protein